MHVTTAAPALLFGLLASVSLIAQAADQVRPELVKLRYANFDPRTTEPDVPVALRGGEQTGLWIVQFHDRPTEAGREAVRRAGAGLHGYLPDNSYIGRMSHAVAADVARQAAIRSATYYHPAFRLEPGLVAAIRLASDLPTQRYNIVVVDKVTDKGPLAAAIGGIGGRVEHEQHGSILLEATLSRWQLVQVAHLDQVLWIDRWTPPELDMDNGRIQGGGNYVETQGGYTGKGIRGHVYEGVEATHQDFTNTPISVLSCGSADTHGHCTAGIVFGNGNSISGARGMAPDAQPYYTTYSCVASGSSRWQVVQALVSTHEVMFTTASWGGGRTRAYTSVSAATDDIIFDHGIAWTQSQSNAGNQDSRPEAWAKNIFSIGGVAHRNNANPLDDSWQAGAGSTGPAADGRIKPDLCAYYDGILTSDRSGSAGYTAGNYTTGFGGTSGATPMVAGHNALAIQMFTDGLFGPQRVPNGTRFQNRPKFTTLKALQIANAAQYSFSSSSSDNRREHQGWGFPDLKSMWDNRNVHYVIDETDVLSQGTGTAHIVRVAGGQAQLKVSMCFADPAANPAAAQTRINDLTLRVTDPIGRSYWGNAGLRDGLYSITGGSRDETDTVENVFVQNPMVGDWKVEVLAYLVAQDAHLETTAADADYGLVVNGATFVSKSPVMLSIGSFLPFGSACLGTALSTGNACLSANTTGGVTLVNMRDNVGYAIEVVAPSSLTVTGFDLQAQTQSASNQILSTALYLADASGAPGTVAATGTITFGAINSWATTVLNPPVQIGQGQRFFLYFLCQTPAVRLAGATSGTDVPYYRLTNNQWSSRVTGRFNWTLRVNCPGGRLAPLLSSTDTPTLGQGLDLRLDQARANAPALLLLGASRTQWNGNPLPFGLAPLGAAGCNLYVSLDAIVALRTDALGTASARLTMPTSQSMLGVRAYAQYAVDDPGANGFGLVTTTGAEIKLGN